jgi:hypothetical protein
MAHFAELDHNNKVLRVIVVNNSELLENGSESEAKGIDFCVSLFGGKWIQTSYNAKFRKCYAGIDFIYDEVKDIFIEPQPYPSWKLDNNGDWQPPKPKPEGFFYWSEELGDWQSA